jgi:DNA-binding response OmpR family regulator
MKNGTRIFLVEDDANLAFVIKDNLMQRGCQVTHCSNGKNAQEEFIAFSYQICLVDVMLPLVDGFTVARHIRNMDKQVPILFLTAKDSIEDKRQGFGSGADDYITKPFSFEELFFRIDVFLRRSKNIPEKRPEELRLGTYVYYSQRLLLVHGTNERVLTQREAHILELLYKHANTTLKREEILHHVWGANDYFMGRSLDVFISKLRKYLQDDDSVQIINFHGVGFSLQLH